MEAGRQLRDITRHKTQQLYNLAAIGVQPIRRIVIPQDMTDYNAAFNIALNSICVELSKKSIWKSSLMNPVIKLR